MILALRKTNRAGAMEDRGETNYEQRGRHDAEQSGRNWQSVRTLLDGLILAGVIGIVWSQINSHEQINAVQQESRVQAATIIGQIANIQYNTADVPALRDRITHIETVQGDLLRREAEDDVKFETLKTPASR